VRFRGWGFTLNIQGECPRDSKEEKMKRGDFFFTGKFIPIPAHPVMPAKAGIQRSECAYFGRQCRFLPPDVHRE